MPDTARLPWKHVGAKFCVCFLLSVFHPTFTLSKQLVSLYFDHFSCYQHLEFPRHFPVTLVQGTSLSFKSASRKINF